MGTLAHSRRLAWSGAVVLALGAGMAIGRERLERDVIRSFPRAPVTDLSFTEACLGSVKVFVNGADQIPWRTTIRGLIASPAMWRRLHVADWNRVPRPLREAGLDAMLARYRDVATSPDQWDAMTATDWDDTPQPIRTVAFRRMTAYWAGYYGIAPAHALPAALVTETLAAIVMSESWFNHRAVAHSAGGGADLGLGQASPFARVRLRQLHQLGAVDVAFTDEEYNNPWKAARFAAVWLMLMLDESRGDLERAVRAYHRGMADALDRRGDNYYATVQQRLRRYIRNVDAPVAWDYLWRRARRVSEWSPDAAVPPVAGADCWRLQRALAALPARPTDRAGARLEASGLY